MMKSAYVKTLAMAALAISGISPGVGQAQLLDLGATTGYALNDSGQAALESHGETTTFTYRNGAVTILDVPCTQSVAGAFSTDLCAPDANDFGNSPNSINDSGDVVGTITLLNSNYGQCAYLVINNVWMCLGHGTGYAINASGEVTGSLETFKYDEPPGTGSADGGQVIGTYAFLYDKGTTSDLGTLPGGTNSTGYAINATGQIVGSSDFTGSGKATHAFFYNGVMTDLNAMVSSTDPLQPFVTLTSGVAINDSRLILANGVDSRTGKGHAYRQA